MDTNYVLIKDMRPGLKNINTVFIVLEVGHPTLTKENREVRTFKVADQSACINASVWDEAGQLLAPGDIVKLTKGYASVWRNCLTLYTSKLGDLQKIGEFCMVFNEQLNMSEPNSQLMPMIPSSTSQPNNVPINNGTNNGAGRIAPTQSSNALVLNNISGPIKGPTTTNRFNNNAEPGKTQKNAHNRGRGNHNRNNTRDRR